MFLRHSPATTCLAALAAALAGACAASMPASTAVRIPAPIPANTGRYMSPYTADGTVAPWVRTARTAQAGAAIGGFAGRKAGEHAASSVPFVGGFLGKRVGASAGRAAAMALVGGERSLREQSDLSFESADQLAVYLYAFQPPTASARKEKEDVLKLTYAIYPDVQSRWAAAIKGARLRRGETQVAPWAVQAATGGVP
jgi:hypothetical protein